MTASVTWVTTEPDHARHASLDSCPTSGFRPGTCVLTLCGHQYCTETPRPVPAPDCCPTCARKADMKETV